MSDTSNRGWQCIQPLKYGILMGQIMETASSREDQGPIFGATTPTWEGKQSEKVKKIKIKITPT